VAAVPIQVVDRDCLARVLSTDRRPFARAREAAIVAAYDVPTRHPTLAQARSLVAALEIYEANRGGPYRAEEGGHCRSRGVSP